MSHAKIRIDLIGKGEPAEVFKLTELPSSCIVLTVNQFVRKT